MDSMNDQGILVLRFVLHTCKFKSVYLVWHIFEKWPCKNCSKYEEVTKKVDEGKAIDIIYMDQQDI